MLNSVVKISMMFAKYFEYYTIILGGRFLWTRCKYISSTRRSTFGDRAKRYNLLPVCAVGKVTVVHALQISVITTIPKDN